MAGCPSAKFGIGAGGDNFVGLPEFSERCHHGAARASQGTESSAG